MSKLVKKQTHVLQHGDVIYFVYRKSEPEQSELFMSLAMRAIFVRIYKRKITDSICSYHPVDIAYVYHSIKTEQTFSQQTYGK